MDLSFPRLRFLYPLLLGIIPVITLLAHNIDDTPLLHAVRPAIAALLLTVVALALTRRLVRDWELAAQLTSLFLLLFFSYGHVYFGLVTEGVLGLFQSVGLIGNHAKLALAWALLFALGASAMYRVRTLRPVMTQLFSMMGLVLLAWPLVQIAAHELQLSRPWPWLEQERLIAPAGAAEAPDIYMIVLDGHGRSDVLQEIYGYDNSQFIAGLREHGFFVAEQARSNYAQTSLSLASSLNLSYLDFLGEDPGPHSDDRTPVARLIRHSRLRTFLEEHGYDTIGLSSGYRVTELEDGEVFLRWPIGPATTFERLVIETSGAALLLELPSALGRDPWLPGYLAHRERVLFQLEALESAVGLPGPKFVLAHFLVPHPPFVFDAAGAEPPHRDPFTLRDGNAFLGTRAEYLRGYREQITYVDRTILETISLILERSAAPPVIVLMGDHGPGSGLVWESAEQTDLLERTAILNAYYLPGVPHTSLSDSLSPVNSFRLILNWYFGTDLDLLPDQSFFTTWDRPYEFILVP